MGEAAAAAAAAAAVLAAAEALRRMAEDAMEPRPVRRAAFNALHLLLRYALPQPPPHRLSAARACETATSKAEPRQGAEPWQDWFLKCLGRRAHPLAACGMATLCCSPRRC